MSYCYIGENDPGQLTIFISYAWKCRKDAVQAMAKYLKRDKKLNVWFDLNEMSESINDKMAEGINSADVVLIFCSKAYIDSKNCRREAIFADGQNKKRLFVCLEEFERNNWLGIQMEDLLWISYFSGSDMEKVADEIHHQLIKIYVECNRERFRAFGLPSERIAKCFSDFDYRPMLEAIQNISRTSNGKAKLLLVSGDEGIGKTDFTMLLSVHQHKFLQDNCEISNVFYMNCCNWRNQEEFKSEAQQNFLAKLVALVRQATKHGSSGDAVAEQVNILQSKFNVRPLFIFDDVCQFQLISFIKEELVQRLSLPCAAITRTLYETVMKLANPTWSSTVDEIYCFPVWPTKLFRTIVEHIAKVAGGKAIEKLDLDKLSDFDGCLSAAAKFIEKQTTKSSFTISPQVAGSDASQIAKIVVKNLHNASARKGEQKNKENNASMTEPLILKDVPFFDNYVARNDEESNIRKGLLNLANRGSKNSKGFCFVVHGCGGIGKSTLVAHVLQESQHYLTQKCNVQIAVWLNCYQWRDGFNNSDRKLDEFFRKLLDIGKKIAKEQEESSRGGLETKGGDFVSVTQMVEHFAKKGQRILFILDDVFHYSILSSLRKECNSSICCVLTRDASVVEIPDPGSATFLKCNDVANPLKVGYFTDERVFELFLEGDLKGKLNDLQLGRLVRMSCGLPLIVNLILGHFTQNKYKSNFDVAFKDLTEKLKLGEFQIDSIVLGRDENQAKQLFDFSFQSLSPEYRESYFVFLLFEPVEEVSFELLKDLWQIEDEFDARDICDRIERLSLVRHIFVESEYPWEKKDCYVVHQILWEQTLENAKEHYQLATMANIPLIQMGRIHILTKRIAIDTSDRLSRLLKNLNLFTSQSALDAILSHINNDELGSWCAYEVRPVAQLSGKYEKQIVSAAKTNHSYLTRLLLENGANIEAKDGDGRTPLIWASINGHIDLVKLLMEKGSDMEAKEKYGGTLLIWASVNGHIDVVKLLLEKGADIEANNKYGWTPLILASQNGHIDVAKLLMEKGADIEAKDKHGRKPLIMASQGGHLDVVKLLIEKCADIHSKDNDGKTPVIRASENGHLDVVKLLIEKGADIETQDNHGWTPLTLASLYGHLDVVKLLMEKGADIHAQDITYGKTPVICASENGHIDVVKLLMEKGADIHATDNDGMTPLIWASENGHLDVVKLLIEKGADIETKDSQGWTPLTLASLYGHLDVVKFLMEKGADIEANDQFGG